ncbi:MAG: glutathione S-transferase family protein [Myxococcota bacterium]
MSQPILHQYALSPYAEKIRLALGVKGLAWQAVDTPMVLPKDDHFEITGGFRRVPVLQIGADVYCDSALITRELDRRFGGPPLHPIEHETIVHAVSQWSETTFMMVILAFMGIGGIFPQEFIDDRSRTMTPPGQSLEATPMILGTKLAQIASNLERLDALLSPDRRWLVGETITAADLSAYHPVMAMRMHERTAALAAGHPRILEWAERVAASGYGTRTDVDASVAIEAAASAEPATFEGEGVAPPGFEWGQPVVVLPDEFGSGNVVGTLAPSGLHEIAVERTGDRVGRVVVHFPRETYAVVAAG